MGSDFMAQPDNIVIDLKDILARHEVESPELLMDLVIYVTLRDFKVSDHSFALALGKGKEETQHAV